MIMKNDIELKNIQLPKTNGNEDLETISENNLMPLFDTSMFEFCTKDRRDKGIDITFDTKKDGSHLGFRFIIQLKATNSILPNKDGSLSKSIDTSNINFLLHNNHLAYYILHDQSTNTFYYENLHEFIKTLQIKSSEWEFSQSHVLRFSKKLTVEEINKIYEEVIKWGISQRELRLQTIYISGSLNSNDRITIDSEYNVIGDNDIRAYIEKFGFQLINDGHWNRLLEINNKATGNLASTNLYNLIIGIANYYAGNRWVAISHLNRAKNADDLDEEQQFQLLYFDSTVRFSYRLIDQNEYKLALEKLEQSKSIGLYIKLHRIKQNYLETITETEEGQFEFFKKQINEIINDPEAHKSVVLTAQCELILYQGHENNHNYLRGITKLNIFEEEIGIDLQVRINSAKQFMDANYECYKFVSDVTNDAKNSNHVFNYFLALLNEVIVSFKFLAYTSLHRVLKKIPGISTDESTSNAKSIDIKLTHINEVFDFFKSIGHVENMIVALATKYEILKFSEQNNEADELMIELEFLIAQNDFLEYKAQTDKLKNGGCVREVFKQLLDDIAERTTASKLEFESLIEDMKSMDEKELPIKTVSTDSHNITLFPIGEFTFPKTETKKSV